MNGPQPATRMSSLLSADQDQTRSTTLLDSTTLPHATSRSQRQERLQRLDSLGVPRPDSVGVPRPDSLGPAVSRVRPGASPDPYLSPRESRPSARRRAEGDLAGQDFRKLYEGAVAANGRLRSRLDTSREELALVQSQLGRVTGQQQRRRATDRAANMLEMEKKENQSLEKKISDMEEELKAKTDLSTENQRLKDENGALIRVISKLSK
ncbi:protein phosphatase 1 regulatory subunit 12B-like [Gadus macrocephalus]|uniref:protein phosphatase 1 regulatory subunit 12B-like n=1 Tax=Gadus macrocephalus TaxID=80720 RepID=UPI0028CB34D1|nr:protein phosphatase 1 regulatory subunit 12B-like [Gadus macrocephalus]